MNGPAARTALAVASVLAFAAVSACCLIFQERLGAWSTAGYLGLALACTASNASVLVPSSSTMLVSAAALALDPALCGIAGGIGSALGEQMSYWLGRCGRLAVGDAKPARFVARAMARHPYAIVFLASLIPNPLYDAVGICAGVARLNPALYFLACALGKALKHCAFAIAVSRALEVPPGWIKLNG
jgi:membrane protein YqaA with SNARE-associated domain